MENLLAQLGDHAQISPLHEACHAGRADAVKVLLKHRALPSAVDWMGNTAIHLAAAEGHDACIAAFGSFTHDDEEATNQQNRFDTVAIDTSRMRELLAIRVSFS